MQLDARKNKVLQAIIEDYVSTAEPVGSRTIARKYRLGVSPATIRNEMSDLEELGYLEQPHTSAGRVPSDRGYRYFVDTLMAVRELTPPEQEALRHTFERKMREVDALIRETVRLLGESTHLASVVVGPQVGQAVFKEVHLVPVARDRALLVYVTDAGFVENTLVDLPIEVTTVELQRVGALLTDRLRGESFDTLGRGALQAIQQELRRYGVLLEQALEFLSVSLQADGRQRYYFGGATNILGQPEFRDVEKARALLAVMEREEVLGELFQPEADGTLSVQIGEEIKVRQMQECSIISATYRCGDRVMGRLGVIGPKRMDYAHVVAVVDQVAQRITETLQRSIRGLQ